MYKFNFKKPPYNTIISIREISSGYYYGAKMIKYKNNNVLIIMEDDYQKFNREFIYNLNDFEWDYIF